MNEEDNHLDSDTLEMLSNNTRAGHGDYWYWRDKPEGEYGAAKSVLEDAGRRVEGLRSLPREEQHPDLEADIDGQRSAIEVTELVHQESLQRSIREKCCYYFEWSRDSFLNTLQEVICRKDNVNIKEGYEKFILIIVTDEFIINKFCVSDWLSNAEFDVKNITSIYLGLSYHPEVGGNGSCPVFELNLQRESN